jgi:hypothetical protein
MPNALGLLAEPQMRATPRNKLMGLLADALQGAQDYAQRPDPRMPGGKANPVLGLLADAASLQSLATTAQRVSYGEPLTNKGKANVPFLKPETADVAMMAPLSPRNALAALGMMGGGVGGMERAIFAGIGAKTADKAALAKAEQLAAKGADPKAIWRDTGWFKGGDGKWRFEIDDSKAKVLKTFKTDAGDEAINLDDAVSHPALYAAYPDAATMGARHMNFGPARGATFGGYNSTKDTAVMNSAHPMFKDAAAVRSGLLHEIQHGIQQREGMGLGGKLEAGLDEYRRLAGEAEARAVQARMGLTAKQRRELFPLDSYDIPAASLIYR